MTWGRLADVSGRVGLMMLQLLLLLLHAAVVHVVVSGVAVGSVAAGDGRVVLRRWSRTVIRSPSRGAFHLKNQTYFETCL